VCGWSRVSQATLIFLICWPALLIKHGACVRCGWRMGVVGEVVGRWGARGGSIDADELSVWRSVSAAYVRRIWSAQSHQPSATAS
jgi:hypothetical protein